MNFNLQQSFEDHSQHYGSRVRDRKKYANLSLEDKLMSSFIRQNWQQGQTVLLDAACGTGDRLRIIFENAGLPRSYFKRIIGYDYAQGMIDIAASQKLNEKPLYDELRKIDLLEPIAAGLRADLILCLWGVINGVGKGAARLIANLADILSDGGFLVYDVNTTKATAHWKQEEEELLATHPELKENPDPQQTWYQRDDKSIGYLRMCSPTELNDLLAGSKLRTCKVWGYRHQELVPYELTVTEGMVDEDEVTNYSGLLVIQQK